MSTQKEIEIMANSIEKNGWNEWAKYVLMSLEELKNQHSSLTIKVDENRNTYIKTINELTLSMSKEINELRSDLTVLKTRFAVRTVAWSSVVPGIVGGIMLLIKLLG